MKTLFSEGYISLSLKEYYEMSQKSEEELANTKFFTVAFLGGKLDVYKYAFPIMEELGIKASFFLEIDNIGKTDENNIQFFGWHEAQQMLDSGLVNFYLLWDSLHKGDNFKDATRKKINTLKQNIAVSIQILL